MCTQLEEEYGEKAVYFFKDGGVSAFITFLSEWLHWAEKYAIVPRPDNTEFDHERGLCAAFSDYGYIWAYEFMGLVFDDELWPFDADEQWHSRDHIKYGSHQNPSRLKWARESLQNLKGK